MADNNPNIPNIPTPSISGVPSGAMPPKKETGKVQPKKETVRINLPPKPTAAPTIKLPTLPPGAPSAVPGAARSAPVAGAPSALRTAGAAPASAQRPAPAAAPAAKRPVPAAAPKSALDTVLAIFAIVAGVAAIGSTVYLGYMF